MNIGDFDVDISVCFGSGRILYHMVLAVLMVHLLSMVRYLQSVSVVCAFLVRSAIIVRFGASVPTAGGM